MTQPSSIEDQLRNLVLQQQPAAVGGELSPSVGPATTAVAVPFSSRNFYTPQAMVELMLQHPDYSHAMLCSHFGRPASWLATVLASDAFQQALEPYREQIADPSLTATMQERFKALAIRTSNVMLEKMDSDKATDFLVLKAGEIAIKALGMGQKGVEQPAAPANSTPQKSLEERLLDALDKRRAQDVIDADAEDITPNGEV